MTDALARARLAGPCPGKAPAEGRRIGFVSVWFERGQAYVTRMLRDALEGDFTTHILARTGSVHGDPHLETGGGWDVPRITAHGAYDIPAALMTSWIRDNRLDTVVFNEEYDWQLIAAAKSTGARIITYLDFYRHDWAPLMPMFDGVWCATRRTFAMVRGLCRAHYIGWAVDAGVFRPRPDLAADHTFFHNAGWLGINFRKMTPAVILAFEAISRVLPEVTLFVHAQAPLEKLPPAVRDVVRRNPRITYHVETVPAPGLYHRGRILLFPSKLEGLGLPLVEGLACGLPAIATDAPPMNEFVAHGRNGLLVKAARHVSRRDAVAFPETLVDVNDLACRMAELAGDPDRIAAMAAEARQGAVATLGMAALRRRLGEALAAPGRPLPPPRRQALTVDGPVPAPLKARQAP